MSDWRDTRVLAGGIGILLAIGVCAAMILSGTQVSAILSKVGASVTGGTSAGSGGGDLGGSGSGGTAGANGGGGGQVAEAAARPPALLIVRTGTLDLQVADLDRALADAEAAVGRSGGYVSGSNRVASGQTASASVDYRIPSPAWTATLATLRGLASRVLGEHVTTEEVTGQVVDLGARIANLRAAEAALQAIMTKATKISDVLEVQAQLTTTRGEIEKAVAEKTQLEDRASFGSLTVTFRLPVAPAPSATPAPSKGWDPADDVARASGKLVRIGQTSTSIGIWLGIVGLPLVVAAAILLVAGWQVVRIGRWLLARRARAADGIA